VIIHEDSLEQEMQTEPMKQRPDDGAKSGGAGGACLANVITAALKRYAPTRT